MDRFDDDAVRRILARVQRDDVEFDEGVDAFTLVEAAEEVGYDPDAVRDSVAIELLGPSHPPSRALDVVAGPSTIVRERELALDAELALERAAVLLERMHRMSVRRTVDDRVVARRRTDLRATFVRFVTVRRGDAKLGRLAEVEVAVVPLHDHEGDGRSMVRLSAVRAEDRRRRLTVGGALSGTGVGVLIVGVAESLFAWPLVAGSLIGAGVVSMSSGRRHADRVDDALDDLLHDIGVGRDTPGALRRAADAARRSMAR